MLKKAAFSLFVIGASGAYGANRERRREATSEAMPASAPLNPKAVAALAAEPPLTVREPANSGNPAATAPRSSVEVRSAAIGRTKQRRRIKVDFFPGLA